jgi:hypothetical protein
MHLNSAIAGLEQTNENKRQQAEIGNVMKNSNYSNVRQGGGKWKLWGSTKSGASCIVVLSLSLAGWQSSAQGLPYSEDFNSGAAPGLTVLDSLGMVISQPGTFTFPGGNTYRLEHPAIPSAGYVSGVGMARMSSWATSAYTTNHFQIMVDLLDLEESNVRQEFGINAHGRNFGPGTTTAYTFHYLPLADVLPGGSDGFTIERTFTEVFQSWMSGDYSGPYYDANWYPGCTSSKRYHLDPAKDYRLAFMGSGLRFEGRVYDLSDLSKPVCVVVCNYSGAAGGQYEFTNGTPGIQVQNIYGTNAIGEFGSYVGPCAATVDNFSVSETYSAYPGTPAVPSLSVTSLGGTNYVNWPGEVLGLWTMEQSPGLGAEAAWTDIPVWQVEYDAASGLRKYVATNSPMGFYRLRKL